MKIPTHISNWKHWQIFTFSKKLPAFLGPEYYRVWTHKKSQHSIYLEVKEQWYIFASHNVGQLGDETFTNNCSFKYGGNMS